MKNAFCDSEYLRNESDVEQFFVIRLLSSLGYNDENIKTKKTIKIKKIGKGIKSKEYIPDYILYIHDNPVIIIDVKNPDGIPGDGLKDALLYAREINGDYNGAKPIRFCIGTNGIHTLISNWDENKPFLCLDFLDFVKDNAKYLQLISQISYDHANNKNVKFSQFELIKPTNKEINGIFKKCHNLIRNREKYGPTEAFYEFCKLMFIKLNEDKKLRNNLKPNESIEKEGIVFSTNWISSQQKFVKNPINSILFKELREDLEEKIEQKEKKRIFEKDEDIKLKPTTIKQVVKLLEQYDLASIDDDLNGRLFETFLSATIRGKELGQFFTPRSVVKFMTKLANIHIDFQNKIIDSTIDGSCGTGGFLIEIMADMTNKIKSNKSLSDVEKDELIQQVKNEKLYGIDASRMISRIARINMYLHGDGGSRIYNLDFLDKSIRLEDDLEVELKNEMKEYRRQLLNNKFKFKIVLTNPPFSMRYERGKIEDEQEGDKDILEKYILAYDPETKRMVSSLQSNVMFLERYYEIMEAHGKLIIILDESLLTTPSNRVFRKFITDHFIIKAVISLPENTFVRADTGVKTSILYLIKKERVDEEQPSTFMALCENVGHDDAGKPTPCSNELFSSDANFNDDFTKGILGEFNRFEDGTFKNSSNINPDELPNEKDWKTFVVDKLDKDRLDVKFHSPYLKLLRGYLKKSDWEYLGKLIDVEKSENPGISDFYRLIDLRDVEEKTAKVLKIKEVEELNSTKLVFKEGQLLISTLSPEKGKIILVDKFLSGCVGSTELVPVTLKKDLNINGKTTSLSYLWVVLRSKMVLDQWKYQVTGATPSRYRIGERELLETIIPIPSEEIQSNYATRVIKSIDNNKVENELFYNKLNDLEKGYTKLITSKK